MSDIQTIFASDLKHKACEETNLNFLNLLIYIIMSTFQISKSAAKMLLTIETLTAKSKNEPLTSNELVRLINAKLNVENKTLSGVYKNLFVTPSTDILELVTLMCGSVIPTFATFKTVMLEKDTTRMFFSNYSGLLAAARLSKSAQLAAKVAKQGGKISKVAAEVVPTKAAKVATPKAAK